MKLVYITFIEIDNNKIRIYEGNILCKKAALLLCVFGVIIVSANIVLKINDNISVSIIGGADGPTSIFLAGKVGEDFTLLGIIVGLILIVSATILFVQRKR